jgi:tetratricopeptide (TPR) repeat protein
LEVGEGVVVLKLDNIMKLHEIFKDKLTQVFIVINSDDENELEWTIEPTNFELLPEEENIYFVKAVQVFKNRTSDCFLGIMTPERIAETVVKINAEGEIMCESIYDQDASVIPAVASECFGNYELYYSQENPQMGIDVLKNGISKAVHKSVVAEDLAYVLRDAKRAEEALEAFKISEELGPTSGYIFLEISRLYDDLGQPEKKLEYEEKFKNS